MADEPSPIALGIEYKDGRFYSSSIGSQLTPLARKVLEEYSHIPPSEVESHVYQIRDKAWKIRPYPCIGHFQFLNFSLSKHPSYPIILSRLTTPSSQPQTLLDLGCCFGQDIRKLVVDGVPSSQLYGCDLQAGFFALGYELFLDQGSLRSTFFEGDVFAGVDEDKGRELVKFDGKFDVVHAASFLHLFDWARQVAACERIVKLLRPVEGSLCLGHQVGNGVPGDKEFKVGGGYKVYRQNAESFQRLWKEVGEKTGTKWKVEVQCLEAKDGTNLSPLHDENTRRLIFAAFRE